MEYSSLPSLPEEPGVYIFKGKGDKIIYIGKAKNLKKRVASYFLNSNNRSPKKEILISQIEKIDYILVKSDLEALILEANLIKKYQPKYNIALKDNKTYPFLKITHNEKISRIFITRKVLSDKGEYFGPYPDSKALKFLYRHLRLIYPFCTCQKEKKSCLYKHLNLCPVLQTKEDLKKYSQSIKQIKMILSGKSGKLLKVLEKEMINLSNQEKYEEAQKIKDLIAKIKSFLNLPLDPLFYEKNPWFVSKEREKELEELAKALHLPKIPQKIECFDISNLSGQFATGSMVVSQNGFLDKKLYRKFKIKTKKTPDDYFMLQEVMRRRLNHPEWKYPDLLVIDGGLGQVSAVLKVLKEKNLNLPVIGLAKRNEEIILPNGQKINLPKNSPALLQLQRLRDESHRFALKYHLFLRSKKMLK